MSLKHINDDDKYIDELEIFVREDLLNLLKDECINQHATLDDADKKYFFGLYHAKPVEFRFLPGERFIIKEIAGYVKDIVDRGGHNKHLASFKAPDNYKMSRKDTCRLFGLTFFGQKSSHKHSKLQLILNDAAGPTDKLTGNTSQGLAVDLIPKLKAQFESKDPSLGGQDYLSESMVEIKNNGNRITALVQCVFCHLVDKKNKRITIQFDVVQKSNNAYWNFSNLKKHLKLHSVGTSKLEEVEEDGMFSQIKSDPHDESLLKFIEPIEPQQENGVYDESVINQILIEESSIIEVHDGSSLLDKSYTSDDVFESEEFSPLELAIYDQISQQNLKMTRSICTYSEKKKKMLFSLNGDNKTLRVINIPADGNCLFGSVAHQLNEHKVNSTEHKSATVQLREITVEYIRTNLKDFAFDIRGRIMEDRESRGEEKSSKITDRECEDYVKNCLVLRSCFGGAESLKAISKMFNVNILVFEEKGIFYLPLGFNTNYNRTISIAYRLAVKSISRRNHYDSVAEVQSDILCDCVNVLEQFASKKSDQTIEID